MTQKSILITGCSSGIGYDAAHGLRRAGWHVFASCRAPEDCDRLRSEGFDAPVIDYRDHATITDGLARILDQTDGQLDAVFNNGAFALPGAVEDLPTDGLRSVFETNVFGVHELTRQILPVMRAQGHGRIVQCSSVLGFVTMPWRGAYSASKFALEGLTDALRLELRDAPVDVILIEPGPITSQIRQNSIPHFERWIDWHRSPHAARYESSLLKRLYEDRGPDRFELPPSAVTETLIKALRAPRPHARYRVTTPTRIAAGLKRSLPTRLLDRLLSQG